VVVLTAAQGQAKEVSLHRLEASKFGFGGGLANTILLSDLTSLIPQLELLYLTRGCHCNAAKHHSARTLEMSQMLSAVRDDVFLSHLNQ